MDSFFSLFDPSSDGSECFPKKERKKSEQKNPCETQIQDTSKRKAKVNNSPNKNAHLPDESSFLCEPDLTNDILVKDISYLDYFIEMGSCGDQIYGPKSHRSSGSQKRNDRGHSCEYSKVVSRRNSGRKNRRRKNKTSPPKDIDNRITTAPAYQADLQSEENEHKLNDFFSQKADKDVDDASVGETAVKTDKSMARNINKLQKTWDMNQKSRRKTEPFSFEEQADGDVGWKLETADDDSNCDSIGTPDVEDFAKVDDDEFNDESDEAFDSSSNIEDDEDSGDETYGYLPPEPQLGNVEYKLKLVNTSKHRFEHLVTQLKWRLRSGGGVAVYELGVRDCGALRGLRARALRVSVRTVRRMASAIGADVARVRTRRLAPNRAVAELVIRKMADQQQSVELRVAVMGANDAGKSTLVGVLTQGELDNGRGSARLNMFRHLHEVRSGRTSSLSHEILGFDAQGRVVNYGCSELMTAERIGERSAKLVAFLDLAGHSKYQRTTVHGLTGYSPHRAMVLISAIAGISRITEEHVALLLALDLPFFVVVNKLDLAPNDLGMLLDRLKEILASSGCKKKPLLIRDEEEAARVAQSAEWAVDKVDKSCHTKSDSEDKGDDSESRAVVPVFPASCVSGRGLNALHAYLLHLAPAVRDASSPDPKEEPVEFQVDEIFRVGGTAGPVVGGLLASGVLRESDSLLIGPLDTGDFVPITVKSIYRNRVPCGIVRAGQSASLGLAEDLPGLRHGMVLVAIPENYKNIDAATSLKLIKDKTNYPIGFEDSANLSKSMKADVRKETDGNIAAIYVNGNNKEAGYNIKDTAKRKTESTYMDIDNYESLTDGENITVSNMDTYNKAGDINIDSDINFTTEDIPSSEEEKDFSPRFFTNKRLIGLTAEDSTSSEIDSDKEKVYRTRAPSVKKEAGLSFEMPGNCSMESDVDSGNNTSSNDDEILQEDPNDPRGCLFFQASMRVLRHSTSIFPGLQATVHIGNIRQTAVIEGVMSRNNLLCPGDGTASALFRFSRQPEYVRVGRRVLFRAGLATRAVGRVTQVFPFKNTAALVQH